MPFKPFICLCVLALSAQAASLRPAELKCEYRVNPQGIDVAEPRLTWTLTATAAGARDLKQSAYRLLVASTTQNLAAGKGDLWDTGKVVSCQSVLTPYQGKPLQSGMQAFWKVQVWDQSGNPSAWSDSGSWSMGLLNPGDWKAKWIGLDEKEVYKHPRSPFQQLRAAKWIWFPEGQPASHAPAADRWFKATVDIPAGRTVRHAVFVMGADDGFELLVNGRKAGRGGAVKMPEVLWIEDHLKPGMNTLMVKADNAKGGSAGLIGALKVEFTSGEPLLLSTGPAWQASQTENGSWVAAMELGPFGMAPWGEVGFEEEHALPARMLRKELTVGAGLTRATAYISGLGLSELEVNGTKAGNDVLSPGLTDYDHRIFYVTHDVTRSLHPGKNALGVMLGNGRYLAPRGTVRPHNRGFGYPKLLMQLELEYADGRRETVATDESWKLTPHGPITTNNEYDGEEHDARMEAPGWSRPGFDDSKWQSPQVVDAPAGVVKAQMAEPLRVTETLLPKKITTLRPGVQIVDMGQNMVGWVRLKVTGAKGKSVMLRFAETLKPDGALYVDNLRSARATDIYTLKGGAPEVWEPRFTYHGFRFVEVTGYPGTLTPASIEGRVVHDAMQPAGRFESSNTMLNRIYHNIYWGVRGNYRSIPTDCPQRDERQGWLGDRSVVSNSESYLFDVAAFYTKWITDLSDSQKPSGSIPDVSPNYWVKYNDGIVWPSTFVLAPSMVYEQYGDARVIESNYPAMKRWVEYMRGFLENGIMPKNTYADWCVPPEKPELIHSQDPKRVTDGALISTAYYYRMLQLMSRYARLIGKPQDVGDYDALAAQVREAFLKKYFRPGENRFDNGTQTSSVLPLAFDMVPQDSRGAVFERLVTKIEKESDNHVGVGLVGAQWLMRTLTENGRADLALTIATQKTYPGWGYMVEKGATTVWELWNGDTADPAMNSGNHVMQIGDLGVWMYEYLAGIRSDPDNPGFKHFVVKPYPIHSLSFAKADHRSPYGLISSGWRREGNKLTLSVTVPPNTSATVYVPAGNPESVKELKGAKAVKTVPGYAVFEVGSGAYTFSAAE